MENEIFMQNLHVGLMITFIGMIVVLAFLTLMIGVMKINEKIIAIYNKYFPEVIEEKKPAKKVIKNADDLANIKNNLSGKYILMNDIDLKGVDWESIGTIPMGKEGCFSGVFDGNGYEIKNLSTNGYDYAGLFGTVYNGSVVNVTISSAKNKR